MTSRQLGLMSALALLGFAANSVLCRIALAEQSIDPASFTAIRLASGALLLWCLASNKPQRKKTPGQPIDWPALSLFVYAVCFSYAYVQLPTASGALLLFGTVQISLLLLALWRRQRLQRNEILALVIANGGLLWLLLPSVEQPPWLPSLLMIIAGMAWAGYTWMGKGSHQPVADTAGNFIRSLPYVVLLLLAVWFLQQGVQLTLAGIWLAVLSGALASGLGYVCWYRALPGLSASQAGVIQLFGPVLAGLGGLWLLQEPLSARTVLAGLIILGGIALSFFKR